MSGKTVFSNPFHQKHDKPKKYKNVSKLNDVSKKPMIKIRYNSKVLLFKCDYCSKQFFDISKFTCHKKICESKVQCQRKIKSLTQTSCEETDDIEIIEDNPKSESSNSELYLGKSHTRNSDEDIQIIDQGNNITNYNHDNVKNMEINDQENYGSTPIDTSSETILSISNIKTSHTSSATCNPCDICGRSFKSLAYLKQHYTNVHQGMRLICKECNHLFAKMPDYLRHYKNCHGKSTPNAYKHKCKHCNGPFLLKSSLDKHVKTNHIQYKCEICGKVYFDKVFFSMHMANHRRISIEEKVNFVSQKYQPSARNKKDTKSKETEIQSKEKVISNSFICDTCEKAFASKMVLEMHIALAHGGTSTSKCDQCDETFEDEEEKLKHGCKVKMETIGDTFICGKCVFKVEKQHAKQSCRMHEILAL